MLKVKIADRFLDLGKTSVSFELLNPIFNDIGSFSYPFTFPNTPGNRAALNFPDRLHNAASVSKSHDCEIYIAGMIWKRGRLIIREANDSEIKANFAVGEGYFYNVIKDLKLNEVDLGGNRLQSAYNGTGQHDIWSLAYSKLYPDEDFTLFHVLNNWFFEGVEFPLGNYSGVSLINDYHPTTKMNVPVRVATPFPYLNYVLNQLFDQLSIIVEYNSLENNDELKQLVIFNNNAMNIFKEETGSVLFPMKDEFNLANHVPKVTFSELFEQLENHFGLFLFYNEVTGQIKLVLFKDILNSTSIEITSDFKKQQIQVNDFDGYELKYEIGVLKEGVNNREISSFNFLGNVSSFSQLPVSENSINDLYFVDYLNRYYYWDYGLNSAGTTVLKWNPINVPYNDFKSQKSSKTFNINSSLLNYAAGIKGNIENDPREDVTECGLSLIFFRGICTDTVFFPYYQKPLGTAYAESPDFAETFNHSLTWHGSKGLLEKFWKVPLEFYRNTRPAEYTMPLTPAQLKQIDFSKKWRWDQADWLIDRIRFTVTNDKISPSNVTAWKVQQ